MRGGAGQGEMRQCRAGLRRVECCAGQDKVHEAARLRTSTRLWQSHVPL